MRQTAIEEFTAERDPADAQFCEVGLRSLEPEATTEALDRGASLWPRARGRHQGFGDNMNLLRIDGHL